MVQGAQEMCVKKLVGIAISQGIKSIVFCIPRENL